MTDHFSGSYWFQSSVFINIGGITISINSILTAREALTDLVIYLLLRNKILYILERLETTKTISQFYGSGYLGVA